MRPALEGVSVSTSLTKPYSPLAKSLHWIIALFIYANLYLGFTLHSSHIGIERMRLIHLHKSIGLTVFLLFFLRAAMALIRYNQRHTFQRHLSQKLIQWSHVGLYLLLFLMPLSGITMSMSLGYYVSLFNIVSIPPLIPENMAVFHISHTAHAVLAYLLIGLLVLHVAVALYHHFILKDRYLSKMLFHLRRHKKS